MGKLLEQYISILAPPDLSHALRRKSKKGVVLLLWNIVVIFFTRNIYGSRKKACKWMLEIQVHKVGGAPIQHFVD
jgi:hypothetical protein